MSYACNRIEKKLRHLTSKSNAGIVSVAHSVRVGALRRAVLVLLYNNRTSQRRLIHPLVVPSALSMGTSSNKTSNGTSQIKRHPAQQGDLSTRCGEVRPSGESYAFTPDLWSARREVALR